MESPVGLLRQTVAELHVHIRVGGSITALAVYFQPDVGRNSMADRWGDRKFSRG